MFFLLFEYNVWSISAILRFVLWLKPVLLAFCSYVCFYVEVCCSFLGNKYQIFKAAIYPDNQNYCSYQ